MHSQDNVNVVLVCLRRRSVNMENDTRTSEARSTDVCSYSRDRRSSALLCHARSKFRSSCQTNLCLGTCASRDCRRTRVSNSDDHRTWRRALCQLTNMPISCFLRPYPEACLRHRDRRQSELANRRELPKHL